MTRTSGIEVVAIDSVHDLPTQAMTLAREQVLYPVLERLGFTLVRLRGSMARKVYVQAALARDNIPYVISSGHGNESTFEGNYGEMVLEVGDAATSSGTIVHLTCCLAARLLGPDFVSRGASAFLGYDDDFLLTASEAETFCLCDAEIDFGFAAGLPEREVMDRTRKRYDQEIERLVQAGKIHEATLLEFNRDHLRGPSAGGPNWGSPDARIRLSREEFE